MFGFLNVYKPEGMTSHDCVAQIRKRLGTKRVGHSGTLDPMAVGVLPIAVNQGTRLLPYLPPGKSYKAVIRFGQSSTTDDREGEIIADQPCPDLTLAEVEKHLPKFVGTIVQLPPAFSAIKQGGKKLYELARSGQIIDLPQRTVTIESIVILNWQGGNYPELTIAINCGTGTYIRSIARDWGQALGVGGMLVALERTFSNGFSLSSSIPLEEVDPSALIPPDRALCHLPMVNLSPEAGRRWQQGQRITIRNCPEGVLRVYQEESFLGMGKGNQGAVCPLVVLSH